MADVVVGVVVAVAHNIIMDIRSQYLNLFLFVLRQWHIEEMGEWSLLFPCLFISRSLLLLSIVPLSSSTSGKMKSRAWGYYFLRLYVSCCALVRWQLLFRDDTKHRSESINKQRTWESEREWMYSNRCRFSFTRKNVICLLQHNRVRWSWSWLTPTKLNWCEVKMRKLLLLYVQDRMDCLLYISRQRTDGENNAYELPAEW